MRIDSVGFAVFVGYADGSQKILSDDCDLECDYANSHYKGKLKSIRKVRETQEGTGFLLYIWGTMGTDEKLRTYDLPLWQLQNLEVK